MEFSIKQKIKYGQIRKAMNDNEEALKLFHQFAVKDDGTKYSDEEWQTLSDDLIFPDGIRDMFTEFQAALVPPAKGAL